MAFEVELELLLLPRHHQGGDGCLLWISSGFVEEGDVAETPAKMMEFSNDGASMARVIFEALSSQGPSKGSRARGQCSRSLAVVHDDGCTTPAETRLICAALLSPFVRSRRVGAGLDVHGG